MHFSNPFEKKSNIKIQGNGNQSLNKKDITRENVKKNLIVALDKKMIICLNLILRKLLWKLKKKFIN